MCSYPKKKRSGWTVEEYEFDDPKPEAPLVTLEAADGEERVRIDRTEPDIIDAPKPDWDTIATVLEKIYSNAAEYQCQMYREMERLELEVADCVHATEFLDFDEAGELKLYDMVKERYRRRRIFKNEYKKATALLNMRQSLIAKGDLSKSFHNIDTQTYKPKVLKNLFKESR